MKSPSDISSNVSTSVLASSWTHAGVRRPSPTVTKLYVSCASIVLVQCKVIENTSEIIRSFRVHVYTNDEAPGGFEYLRYFLLRKPKSILLSLDENSKGHKVRFVRKSTICSSLNFNVRILLRGEIGLRQDFLKWFSLFFLTIKE